MLCQVGVRMRGMGCASCARPWPPPIHPARWILMLALTLTLTLTQMQEAKAAVRNEPEQVYGRRVFNQVA